MNPQEEVLMPLPTSFDEWRYGILVQIQTMNRLHLKQSCGFEMIFKDERDRMQEYLTYLGEYVRMGWAKEEV